MGRRTASGGHEKPEAVLGRDAGGRVARYNSVADDSGGRVEENVDGKRKALKRREREALERAGALGLRGVGKEDLRRGVSGATGTGRRAKTHACRHHVVEPGSA